MKRRQILEKLVLTEISGVDRPCQEHARVTIMKRAPEEGLDALQERVAKLQMQMSAMDQQAFDRLKVPPRKKRRAKSSSFGPANLPPSASTIDFGKLQERVNAVQGSISEMQEPINKFWSIAARTAALAARRAAMRGRLALFTKPGRKIARRAIGRGVKHEAKHAVTGLAREAVYGTAIAGVASAAQVAHEKAQSLLEEHKKKQKGFFG